MTELDLSTLDPGIRNTVAYLRSRGFNTCDSGDGVSKGEDGRDYAHVSIAVPAGVDLVFEARRLVLSLRNVGVEVRPMSMANDPCIQATYDPADDVAIIDLMHVDDAVLSRGAVRKLTQEAQSTGLYGEEER